MRLPSSAPCDIPDNPFASDQDFKWQQLQAPSTECTPFGAVRRMRYRCRQRRSAETKDGQRHTETCGAIDPEQRPTQRENVAPADAHSADSAAAAQAAAPEGDEPLGPPTTPRRLARMKAQAETLVALLRESPRSRDRINEAADGIAREASSQVYYSQKLAPTISAALDATGVLDTSLGGLEEPVSLAACMLLAEGAVDSALAVFTELEGVVDDADAAAGPKLHMIANTLVYMMGDSAGAGAAGSLRSRADALDAKFMALVCACLRRALRCFEVHGGAPDAAALRCQSDLAECLRCREGAWDEVADAALGALRREDALRRLDPVHFPRALINACDALLRLRRVDEALPWCRRLADAARCAEFRAVLGWGAPAAEVLMRCHLALADDAIEGGRREAAEVYLERAGDAYEEDCLGDDDVCRQFGRLAARHADCLFRLGGHEDDALAVFDRLRCAEVCGDDGLCIGRLAWRCSALDAQGRYGHSRALLERSVAALERAPVVDDEAARHLFVEARDLVRAGRVDAALPFFRRSARALRDLNGPGDLDACSKQLVVCQCLLDSGAAGAAGALEYAREALAAELHERPGAAAGGMELLWRLRVGDSLTALGRHGEAFAERRARLERMLVPPRCPQGWSGLRRFDAVGESMHESRRLWVGWALAGVGESLSKLGRNNKALPYHRDAARLWCGGGAQLDSDVQRYLQAWRVPGNAAAALAAVGQHTEALPLLRRALEMQQAVLGPGHPDLGVTLRALADSLGALGRQAEAERHSALALELFAAELERPSGPDKFKNRSEAMLGAMRAVG